MNNKYIRHIRTGTVYFVMYDDVKSRINSDSWTDDVVLYTNHLTGEHFVTDKARIAESFVVLPECPDCNGAGMVHGCFCENPNCEDGAIVK